MPFEHVQMAMQAIYQQSYISGFPMSVGELLLRTRSHYGYTLREVESALHIRSPQIAAIESGRLDDLPGQVYALGFIRSYAEYLGLDPDKVVALFKAQSDYKAKTSIFRLPVPVSDGRNFPWWVILLSLVIGVWVLSGLSPSSEDILQVNSIPTVPSEFKADSLEKLAITKESFGPDKPVMSNTDPGIILTVHEKSWVEIRDKEGRRIVSRVLEAGEQYFVPDRPDLMMVLGNAGGVEIEVDGVILPPLGVSGQVRRNVLLDIQALKAQYADAFQAE